jgi:hypothetical protein
MPVKSKPEFHSRDYYGFKAESKTPFNPLP